jgi:PKD repeat protein
MSKTAFGIYVNGTRIGWNSRSTTTYPPLGYAAQQFCIGELVGSYLANGTYDEFRVTRGHVRHDPNTVATFDTKLEEYDTPYWAYPFAGTYLWIAPTGTTDVGATISGAGSGGQGGYDLGTPVHTYYTGRGGAQGYFTNNTHFKVTPGNSYSVVVGDYGLRGAYKVWGATACDASSGVGVGGASSVFGRTLNGGTIPSVCLNVAGYDLNAMGQNSGATGNSTGSLGETGSGAPGIPGSGFGAGGAGGGQDNIDSNTHGGNGTAGLVWLYAYGSDPLQNYPNFTATPLTTTPGSVVNFTDASVINNPTNIVYTWDFGDGTVPTHTYGNTSHVYGYAGSFSVNLSIAGGVGEMFEFKENYVTVTNSQATTYMVPHSVTLNLVDYNMNPLEGVIVTASPQNFTAPDGWLQQYYGVAPGVELNGTTLTGVSGYDGGWVAPMLGAYRYNFTFYKAGVLNNYSMSMYPSKDEYTLKLPIVGTVVQPTPATNYISYYLYNNTVNSTAENFTIKYKDTSGGTGTIIYNITNSSGYQKANGTIAIAGGVGWVNTTTANVSHTSGESLTVRFSAPQAQVGFVNKSYTVTWDNLKTLGGYPEWVGNWLGIMVLVIFAGSVSLVNVKYAAVILPILALFMVVYTRWLSPVIGATTFIASIGILFTLGVLRYIRDQKGKLGRT